mmetsp:Transcript_102588/g.289859  ORF Transcript_102588/g.289859 Transcript_102588/m.289859 type:complete len:151 (+) Transcript_102588:428-880(+)
MGPSRRHGKQLTEPPDSAGTAPLSHVRARGNAKGLKSSSGAKSDAASTGPNGPQLETHVTAALGAASGEQSSTMAPRKHKDAAAAGKPPSPPTQAAPEAANASPPQRGQRNARVSSRSAVQRGQQQWNALAARRRSRRSGVGRQSSPVPM